MAPKLKSLSPAKPGPDEIARTMESVLHTLPTATPGRPTETSTRAAEADDRLVQINFRCSVKLAKVIDDLCAAEHITQRAAVARAFQALGFDIPDADLKAESRKRRYDR